MTVNFSRELGDKCLEVSRCLAEMSVIKQELIDKTNLLHASQVTPSFGSNFLTNSKAKCMFCLNQVGGMQPSPHHQQDAFLRERQSLMFLQQLLGHTIQVLGLWKIVCEHQVLMTPSRNSIL